MLDLEAIKARLAAATPGPWKKDRSWWITGSRHIWRSDLGEGVISDQLICQICGPGHLNHARADQDFIIAAPADIAALIEEIERLREQRDGWKEEANRGFDWDP